MRMVRGSRKLMVTNVKSDDKSEWVSGIGAPIAGGGTFDLF